MIVHDIGCHLTHPCTISGALHTNETHAQTLDIPDPFLRFLKWRLAVYCCNIVKIESFWIPPPLPNTHKHTLARLKSIRHCPTLPQPPLNGYLCASFSSSSAQRMVQFCCDKGYTLSGVSMATCNQDTGEWEPQTPDCLRKKSYNSFGSLIYYFWEMSEFLQFK